MTYAIIAAMATYTYRLSGDPKDALSTALNALGAQKYVITRDSEWSATAEIGSQGKVILLGGFAPHIRLSVSVATQGDGVALRLVPTTTGAAGGLLGMSKLKKAVKAASDGVRDALQSTGQLTGVDVSS